MPRERGAARAVDLTAPAKATAAASAVLSALLLTACVTDLLPRSREPGEAAPGANRATTASATVLATVMTAIGIIASSRQLRFALMLATPGHPGTDLPRAQQLLRELTANPEMLLPGERALAFLELQQIDDHLTLEAENRRLETDAVRADRERLANLNRRLQLESDENARLRKELEEARAKLDAIANIERSLNERKPSNEGRPQ